MRILLIDDEEGILNILSSQFEMFGYEVCTANSTSKGLRMAKENTYDIIVTDSQIPNDFSGLELLKKLKESNISSKTIMLSGYITDEMEDECNATLQKPWNFKQIKNVLENL